MTGRTYTIAQDGDVYERRLWTAFAQHEFPSYERFWQRRIVPLTHRPRAITLKSDGELAADNKGPEDITIAQLHYTCLFHLGRVHDLLTSTGWDRNKFIEALSRLVSATDVADELLQRNAMPGHYDPWSERAGMIARSDWRRNDNALKLLRDYRNRLVHGRVPPEINIPFGTGSIVRLPEFEKVELYLDWRHIYGISRAKAMSDFDLPATLAKRAWRPVLDYLEDRWNRHLL